MDVARKADSPDRDSPAHRPDSALTTDPARAASLFEQSAEIMARLRAPGGCPWDREQTFDTIRKYTLEEAYEVFDAIERRDFPHLAEELGDLLLQVLFYAEMAANEGRFTIADVLDHLNRKLIRRHPHVFGEEASRAAGNRADVDADVQGSASAVLRNWEEIKAAEKTAKSATGQPASRLDSVQRAMPALAEASKIGAKAAKAGFDWPHWRDLLPKLAEETAELEAEAASDDPARKPAIEAEQARTRETASAGRARALYCIQQPFIDAQWTMEPHGVVDARHDERAVQGGHSMRQRRRIE